MPDSAAFFDLDRTAVEGPTGPAFSDALRELGLLGPRRHPLETVLFGLYELIGETAGAMGLSRQAVGLTAGWDEVAVADAGRIAATRLLGSVAPFLRVELEAHRRAGRGLVLATTSPDELARPLAASLGFDDVIATRYGRVDGRLDGTIDGPFVWGEAKWRAVQEWSTTNGVDLAGSVAYSDSYHDIPLLAGVGSARVVNPDPRLAVVARQRGWPIRSLSEPLEGR